MSPLPVSWEFLALYFELNTNIISAAFHPLSNRKHHCRLCGQIICSLPIKHPQRNVLCSTLFVVDAYARQIEEVGEGVDYGVKRRKMAKNLDQPGGQEEEDKFLKGVRICRQCRPILLCVCVPTFTFRNCR
jgi:rabenosyn-5